MKDLMPSIEKEIRQMASIEHVPLMRKISDVSKDGIIDISSLEKIIKDHFSSRAFETKMGMEMAALIFKRFESDDYDKLSYRDGAIMVILDSVGNL